MRAETGWLDGFPVGVERKPSGQVWMTHCYGTLGVGRENWPDTGSGAELYVVIGQAPRQLDRNIVVAGRVLRGIEWLVVAAARHRRARLLRQARTAHADHARRARRRSSGTPSAAPSKCCAPTPRCSPNTSNRAATAATSGTSRRAGHIDVCNIAIPVRDSAGSRVGVAAFRFRKLDMKICTVPSLCRACPDQLQLAEARTDSRRLAGHAQAQDRGCANTLCRRSAASNNGSRSTAPIAPIPSSCSCTAAPEIRLSPFMDQLYGRGAVIHARDLGPATLRPHLRAQRARRRTHRRAHRSDLAHHRANGRRMASKLPNTSRPAWQAQARS